MKEKREAPFGVMILFALSMINALVQLIVCLRIIIGLIFLPLVLLYMYCCFKMLSGSKTCLKILLIFTVITSVAQVAFLTITFASHMSDYLLKLFIRNPLLNYLELIIMASSLIGGFVPSFVLMAFTMPLGGGPSGPVKVPPMMIYLRILVPIIVILIIDLIVHLIIKSNQVKKFFNL